MALHCRKKIAVGGCFVILVKGKSNAEQTFLTLGNGAVHVAWVQNYYRALVKGNSLVVKEHLTVVASREKYLVIRMRVKRLFSIEGNVLTEALVMQEKA